MCIYIVFLFIEEAYLAYFTTLIYHNVLINNKTEQDTEQDTDTIQIWPVIQNANSSCIVIWNIN